MFKFDKKRFEAVVDGAIALRPEIEACADKICGEGYKNLYLIGAGGTYAHYLPLQYMAETLSELQVHVEIAAEFMVKNSRHFSKDSVCVFCSRTGNTKEIVAAAQYCKERGARTVAFVAHKDTPLCKIADHVFINYADDDHLGSPYTYRSSLLSFALCTIAKISPTMAPCSLSSISLPPISSRPRSRPKIWRRPWPKGIRRHPITWW